jgi:hypothetical protein
MKTTTLDLLCHPLTHDSLQLTPDHLLKGKLTGARHNLPAVLPGRQQVGSGILLGDQELSVPVAVCFLTVGGEEVGPS